MRVTPGSINDRLNADLQAAFAALSRQESLIASGRRINEPADDPGGAAQALTLRARKAANEQFQRNVADARTSLASVDAALRSVIDYLQQAKELAVQGASDSNDATARLALGSQVDQILEAQVSLANTRGPRGAMLFGGQEATVPPYTVTRDVTGKITAVTVNPRGIDGLMPAEVTDGLTVTQGMSGNTAFGAMTDPTNVFDTLIRLRDSLNTNNAVGVRAELDNLTTAHDRATTSDAVIGTRLGWLDSIESRLNDESLLFDQSLSRIEDLDLAKAATDMRQIQSFYEAGLAAGARLLQQSLLNFLR